MEAQGSTNAKTRKAGAAVVTGLFALGVFAMPSASAGPGGCTLDDLACLEDIVNDILGSDGDEFSLANCGGSQGDPAVIVVNEGCLWPVSDVQSRECEFQLGIEVVCAMVWGDATLVNREEDSYVDADGNTHNTYRRDYEVHGGGKGWSLVGKGWATTPAGSCYWGPGQASAFDCTVNDPSGGIGTFSCYEDRGCSKNLYTRACTVFEDTPIVMVKCAEARVQVF